MLWKKLIKKRRFKIRRNYLFPQGKGWLDCEIIGAEFDDRGIIFDVVANEYSFKLYAEFLKRSDIKWK